MTDNFARGYGALIEAIQTAPGVIALGKSGGARLPCAGESDIDLFVICDEIPPLDVRLCVLRAPGGQEFSPSQHAGAYWGVCDFVNIAGTEVFAMYFTAADMDAQITSVLAGERLDREGEYFYPTGRCATLLSLHILYDPAGCITAIQRRLSDYPDALAGKLVRHHLRKIDDAEDFDRAVALGDVLHFHATLELAIDHYLQALFALNHRFFPSRKRTLAYIREFAHKPDDCAGRLLKVVELGARPDTLCASYAMWRALCDDIRRIAQGERSDR